MLCAAAPSACLAFARTSPQPTQPAPKPPVCLPRTVSFHPIPPSLLPLLPISPCHPMFPPPPAGWPRRLMPCASAPWSWSAPSRACAPASPSRCARRTTLLCSRRLDCLRCLRCLRAQRALPASLSPSALSALVHAMLPSHRPSQLLLALLLIARLPVCPLACCCRCCRRPWRRRSRPSACALRLATWSARWAASAPACCLSASRSSCQPACGGLVFLTASAPTTCQCL